MEPKKVVFSIGEKNDFIYIILRGCVNVIVEQVSQKHEPIKHYTISLFDGQVFGETPLRIGQNKSHHLKKIIT